MKIALIALAALVPALASADDPAPYVLHEGIAVGADSSAAGGTSASRQPSAFGTSAIHAGVSSGTPPKAAAAAPKGAARAAAGARGFRGTGHSRHRGVMGASSTGGGGVPAPAPAAAPPYAAIGAKIISAGQPPVYSDPGNAGTHSVEGGGFIDINQSKAHDVGRAPGIAWAPPDTPPSANPTTGGSGGTGASANGPSPVNVPAPAVGAPAVAPPNPGGQTDHGATGFDGSF